MASASATAEFFIYCCHSFTHLANFQRTPTRCQVLGTKRRAQPLNRSHSIGDAIRTSMMLSALPSANFCIYRSLPCGHTIKTQQSQARHRNLCPKMSHAFPSAPFCSPAILPSALCRAPAYVLGDCRDSVLQMAAIQE